MTKIVQRGFREDSLVCGSCQRNFPFGNFTNFVQHKQFDCEELSSEMMEALACQSCPAEFGTPWSLLMHAQNVHELKIYFERSSSKFAAEQKIEKSKSEARQIKAASIRDIENVHMSSEQLIVRKTSAMKGSSQQYDTELADDANICKETSFPRNFGRLLPFVSTEGELSEEKNSKAALDEEEGKNMSIQVEIVKDDKTSMNRCSSASQLHETPNPRPADNTLKKCCSSVVPKKRKRHMETKHMMGGIGSGSIKGRRRIGSTEGPTSIFIDFEPQDEFLSKCSSVQMNNLKYFGGDSESCESSVYQIDEKLQYQEDARFYPSLKQHSVIIQPGMTFSIPVSYSRSMEPSVAIYSSSAPSTLVCSIPQAEMPSQNGRQGKGDRMYEKISHSTDLDSAADRSAVRKSSSCEENIVSASSHQVVPETYVHSEADIGCVAAQGSDVQGQKKRRYPTSRPFKCDQCEDSFNQRIHLQKHQSKHTGVKPFKCDRCDYSTVERSHLKVHIRVHTGEKPYKCTYCGYATAQNSTLKIHLKRHHMTNDGSNIITCGTCGMHFQHHDTFASHAVQEHSQTTCANDDKEPSYDMPSQCSGSNAKAAD